MFKECKKCLAKWLNLSSFLEDPKIIYHGYQAAFESPADGLFLFNHLDHECKTTLAVKANIFVPKLEIDGKVGMAASPKCPGHCKDECNAEACTEVHCVGNQIRQMIDRMKNFPKKS